MTPQPARITIYEGREPMTESRAFHDIMGQVDRLVTIARLNRNGTPAARQREEAEQVVCHALEGARMGLLAELVAVIVPLVNDIDVTAEAIVDANSESRMATVDRLHTIAAEIKAAIGE